MSDHDRPEQASTGAGSTPDTGWRAGLPDRSVLEQAIDAVTVRRVFGEAYEVNGTTVVPVARVRGGGGGGSGSGQDKGSSGGGSGLGYGVRAEPAGVYVITGDRVHWQPAVDAGRITLTLGLAFLAVAAGLGWAAVTRGT